MLNLTLPLNGSAMPPRLLCLINNVKINDLLLVGVLLAALSTLLLSTLRHADAAQWLALAVPVVPALLLTWLVLKASRGCHRALQIVALAIAVASADLTHWATADLMLGLASVMLATLGWWRCKRHARAAGLTSSTLTEALNAAPIVFTSTLVACLGNAVQWH